MIRNLWNWFWGPSKKYTLGAIFIVGSIFGVIFWGGFNTAMEVTNTMDFCISCHEMEENVYTEYTETIHFKNRSGVQATCPDCHVPDPWIYKIVRKIQASNEVLHKILGTIDTPEKFEDKRLTLAKNVWKAMKDTDSRECRNCHSWDAMTADKQKRRAWKRHTAAREAGETCIDCHKGIAHRAVHKLLDEDEDPYDGKPDTRRLPPKEANSEAPGAAETAPEEEGEAPAAEAAPEVAATAAPAAAASSSGGVDLSAVAGIDLDLFYPGQASMEWVLNGKDHGGARAVRKAGDRCSECHLGEQADMGAKIVTGEKAEPTPIPGKRGAVKINMKAVHDETNMIMQFTWKDAGHTPVPFVDGGKMDPNNQIKLAIMFDDGKAENAEQFGCWVTCHNDSRYMPDHPTAEVLAASPDMAARLNTEIGITKYTYGSRTEIEYKGKNGKPRGGWDKMLTEDEMKAKHAAGASMDILRFRSSEGMEEGLILGERALVETTKVQGEGALAGDTWNVTITRPLKATTEGGVSIEAGQLYTVGFALHDDYTTARFHHVSLEYRLGLDNPEAEINVVKQ